jgi:threonine dehydrogenase-like Zn-dependent dehydrogenase
MLAPGGLLSIFAGFAYGHTVPFDLAGVATDGKRITGSTGCTVDDMKDVLAKVLSGDLDLRANIKAIAGLRALPRALDAVSRGIISGKVVVYPPSPDLPFGPVDGSAIRAREQWLDGDGEGPFPPTETGRI